MSENIVYYYKLSDNPIDDIGSHNRTKIEKMAQRYSSNTQVYECTIDEFKGVLLSTHWNGG